MKPSKTIKYNALFLLVSFSLNSVVGFACSLGVDMGFNSHHHCHDGKHHEHSDSDHHDEHDGTNSHGHEHGAISHHHSDTFNKTVSFRSQSEGNCCKDFVVGFQSMDKMVTQGCSSVQQQHIAISPFIIPVIVGLNNSKGFTKHERIPPKEIDLPPPDIVVFIQSFLI